MIYLKHIRRSAAPDPDRYPFNLPCVESLDERSIGSKVLFFVGENGSGKSTLLESIAIASKRIAAASVDLAKDSSLDAVRPLAAALTLGWSRRTGKGFYLRTEDFLGLIKRNQSLESEFDGLIERFKDDDRVRGYMEGNKRAINAGYGRELNDFSHGEGLIRFLQTRIVPGGLYLIDEPEAALSPQRQLAFALIVHDMAAQGCQFVIATHSPIILSVPEAEIWEFGPDGINTSVFEDLEPVRFTKRFLDDPSHYWRHLTAEEE